MELELEGTPELEASGNVEITLPSFMTMLPQDELDKARTCLDKSHVIIAAGRKSLTSEIMLFTADGQMYVLDAVKLELPSGDVIPSEGGVMIVINSGKLVKLDYAISAIWALSLAKSSNVALLT